MGLNRRGEGFLYLSIGFESQLVTPAHGDPRSWSMSHELASSPSITRDTASSSNGQNPSPLESSQLPILVRLLRYQEVVR